jgi:LytS/YehU family sensor histidine kinase
LAFVHLLGFLFFSFLFWSCALLILYYFTNHTFYSNKELFHSAAFRQIADNSISVNLIIYISTIVICYALTYAERNASLENSLLTSNLELLKSQLNTHFLFNTLHTISSLVIRHQNEEANRMLIGLSDLLRFALKENKEQLISVKKELEMLDLYISIQKTRFKERLEVQIEQNMDLDRALIPAMIMQPIVENAIKYAVEPFSGKGKIHIHISKQGNSLIIYTSDNGRTPFDTINFNNGIGLNNTKARLRELYGNQQSFHIFPNQKEDGVTVFLKIPLQMITHEAIKDSNSG